MIDDAVRTVPAADPDLEAFSETYRRYFPRLFAYVYARVNNVQLTEDVVADVFERAYAKASSLRSKEAYSTWLFTIARNAIISHSRKHSRETIVDPEIMRDMSPATTSVENDVLAREEQSDVARLLRGFPQREQDIISLKFDAELTNHQIAEIMELSEPNVRVIIFRTLRKLREMMLAERSRED
jgi:RNA polymerase sigma-70 factor (ECF subfamily)